jgi:PAS domain S-box-containing protein
LRHKLFVPALESKLLGGILNRGRRRGHTRFFLKLLAAGLFFPSVTPQVCAVNSLVLISNREYEIILLCVLLLLISLTLFLFRFVQARKQRRGKLASHARLLVFDQLIRDLSAQLANCPPNQVEREIERGLHAFLTAEGADGIGWFEIPKGSDTINCICTAHRLGLPPSPATIPISVVPWFTQRILQGETVIMRRPDDLPLEAVQDKKYIVEQQIKSLAVVPSSSGSSAQGALMAVSLTDEREWASPLINSLGVLGDIFGNALSRMKTAQEGEFRFRRLFEETAIGMTMVDEQGKLLAANPALSSMLGYSTEELSNMRFPDYTHPEDVARNLELFEELLEGKRSTYEMEKRYVRKDGTVFWGHLNVSLLSRNQPQTLVIGMLQDITQRRFVEETLQSSRALVTSTLDALSAQVAILDETGTIIAVNERWRQVSGLSHFHNFSHGVGNNFLEICKKITGESAPTAQRCMEMLNGLMAGGNASEPIVYRCDDPSGVFWYQLRMSRFKDRGSLRFVLSYENVTELMEMREELRRNQERLHLALDASHTEVWDWDLTKNKIHWSNLDTGSQEEGRHSTSECSDKEFLDRVHPDDRHLLKEATDNTLRQAGDFSVEYRALDKQNVVRWMLSKGRAIYSETGQPIRVLGVNVDITDLKLAQLELHNLTARLIQAQEEERQRISRELHDDIGQRLSLLSVMLDRLSHDLAESQPARSVEVANLFHQVGEIATDTHLLSHQLHSYKLQHLGLKSALNDLCQQISQQYGFAIDVQVQDLPALSAETQLCLYRLAQEALSNVVKHSKTSRASLALTKTDRFVVLTVADSGVGFNPTHANAGLGFASMRERLRMVGGELVVKSQIGSGTEISAEIPVAESRAIAKAS